MGARGRMGAGGLREAGGGKFEKSGKREESNTPCYGFRRHLDSRQTREKLQCLYENLMSNNFHKTAVLKKIYEL